MGKGEIFLSWLMSGACVSDPLMQSTCARGGYCVRFLTVLTARAVVGGASFRGGIMGEGKPIRTFWNGVF